MIQFNELRITPDGKYLIIDASVMDSEYFNNITIDSIIIDNQDTYISTGPSLKPVKTIPIEGEEKHIRTILNLGEENIPNKDMYFVYVTIKGDYAEDTPEEFKIPYIMQTVIYLYPIYKNSMYYIKGLSDSCNIPKDFIDSILRFNALNICIKTGNYIKAIDYWKRFFSNSVVYNTDCYECSR